MKIRLHCNPDFAKEARVASTFRSGSVAARGRGFRMQFGIREDRSYNTMPIEHLIN